MSRTHALAAAVAVAAALTGAVSATAAGQATTGQATTGQRTEVIKLVFRGVADTAVDLGPKGFSAADQDIVAGTVLQHARKIGRGSFVCQLIQVTTKSALDACSVALLLPAGQLTSDGLVPSTKTAGPGQFTLAITGGTGRYRTARGELTVTPQSGNRIPVTVRLVG